MEGGSGRDTGFPGFKFPPFREVDSRCGHPIASEAGFARLVAVDVDEAVVALFDVRGEFLLEARYVIVNRAFRNPVRAPIDLFAGEEMSMR